MWKDYFIPLFIIPIITFALHHHCLHGPYLCAPRPHCSCLWHKKLLALTILILLPFAPSCPSLSLQTLVGTHTHLSLTILVCGIGGMEVYVEGAKGAKAWASPVRQRGREWWGPKVAYVVSEDNESETCRVGSTKANGVHGCRVRMQG